MFLVTLVCLSVCGHYSNSYEWIGMIFFGGGWGSKGEGGGGVLVVLGSSLHTRHTFRETKRSCIFQIRSYGLILDW